MLNTLAAAAIMLAGTVATNTTPAEAPDGVVALAHGGVAAASVAPAQRGEMSAHEGVRPATPDPAPSTYGSAPRPGRDKPAAELTIGYMADAGFAAAVKLTCGPDGGGHPKPAEACTLLTRVGADPGKITPATTACYLLYSPVTAEVTGTWHGATISWKHRYGNACEMRRATGILFQF